MTVFILGLDGGDWSLIRGLVDQGSLPNFARMMDEGATADMQSTHPPITCPAWQSYATGKTPGKLGVYGWVGFDRTTNTISFNGGETFTTKTYFEMLAERGYDVGLVNMPTTYPAGKYEGVKTIAGHPGEEDGMFTNPTSLQDELREAVGEYHIDPPVELQWAERATVTELLGSLFDSRFEAAEWLADEKRCDLVHLTLFATDTIQHHYYDDEAVIEQMYCRIDELLGQIYERADAEAVFVMSDHGFTGREATFSPNQWLVERGDLVVETSSVQRTMNRGGLTKQRLKSSLRSMGLLELARRIVPASIRQRYIPNDDGSTDITKATIDWTETKAVSLGHGPIYVNEQAFAGPSAVESYRNQLKSDLQSVRTPEGRPLVEAVHKAESIYEDAIGFPPDFIVEYRPGVDASNVDVFGPVFGGTTRWTGVHRQTGLFAAIGSGVVSSSTHLAIDDIAPTILHYLDEPIPNDMDGSPELTIFSEPLSDRSPRSCSPVSRRSDVAGSSAADVKDRLEDLGYL